MDTEFLCRVRRQWDVAWRLYIDREANGNDFMERMSSISPQCNELKHKYDDCFNSWFTDRFLKGDSTDVCAPLLKVYQDCVREAIKDKHLNLAEIEKEILNTSADKSQSNTPPDKGSK